MTERANGLMGKILNKLVSAHKTDWDAKLPSALWAYRTAEKIMTKRTPFYLTYGLDSIIPVEFELPTKWILISEREPEAESNMCRYAGIQKLEEDRLISLEETSLQQGKRNVTYDKKLPKADVQDGDLVLVYDSRYMLFPGKLHTHWIGPYRVTKVWDNGSLSLTTLGGQPLDTHINGF